MCLRWYRAGSPASCASIARWSSGAAASSTSINLQEMHQAFMSDATMASVHSFSDLHCISQAEVHMNRAWPVHVLMHRLSHCTCRS